MLAASCLGAFVVDQTTALRSTMILRLVELRRKREKSATCAIVAAMPLTPDQRRDLLLTERTRDAEVIAAVVNRVLAENPDADLLEIEMTFRAAGGTAFLVVTADGFDVIIGMKNWVAALDEFGRTPEMNRQLLAAAANPE